MIEDYLKRDRSLSLKLAGRKIKT